MRIAVIGAGIGGLAAASLLARDGHRVTLVERFGRPGPVGSGLVVQPVGLAVLDELGAGEAARALGAPLVRMLGHAGRRRVLDVAYRRQAPGLAMHRASLFHVLWQAMERSGVALVTGAEVTDAPACGATRRITLASGESLGPFDLVVDASGAGSRLSPLGARPLPFGAVWGHVPWPAESGLPQDMLCQRYERAARMAGILPIGRLPAEPAPRAAVFWSMPRAALDQWGGTEADFARWKAGVATFWPEMAPFLRPLTGFDQMTPARYAHGTLRRPYLDRLAFVGDAAHRASPQLGQGANMALLDAFALSRAMQPRAMPGRAAGEALSEYARLRRWHVRLYQLTSAVFTPAYQSHSRLLPLLRDWILAPASALGPLPALLSGLVSGDLIPPLASTAWPRESVTGPATGGGLTAPPPRPHPEAPTGEAR